jgi:hypothetical protein
MSLNETVITKTLNFTGAKINVKRARSLQQTRKKDEW